ncbi:PREDICTED: C-C motif chemokine 20-like [Cyprinodon variegatus]|uniref:C-C motif chemokine 20-like n=1 Tax=Cyprinodon variegatus TaxID=28743 RepID=UPI000742A9B9|nr:PREDICTED: C-C motif chemokine 20-like [Cyprinodon variegatus]
MTLRSIMVFIIPFFIIVGVLSPADSAGIRFSKHCCKRYDDIVVNIRHIRGYKGQSKQGDCINAIIFHTTSNHEVCANPEDEWVKDNLKSLGSKQKAKRNSR